MIEQLRERRRAPVLRLRCLKCGLVRDLNDDGRRVHYAKTHAAACVSSPAEAREPQMRLISSDHLELHTEDGSTWIQIRRE
jgi:hypothetical protein